MSFAPSGLTDDVEIRTTSSLVDYVFKRIGKDYLSFDDQLEVGISNLDDQKTQQTTLLATEPDARLEKPIIDQTRETITPAEEATPKSSLPQQGESTAPLCVECGAMTMRAGSCYVCGVCGTTTGCS
jgi:ribonucleoside-diphosphate reductase alpha chain